MAGIEKGADEYLKGTAGKKLAERDRSGREIPGESKEIISPIDGLNITLTIDETIQYVAERELRQAVKKNRALRGCVVVMDPKTGEILAMAAYPDFDPNSCRGYPGEAILASGYAFVYEPGSTFKVITAAAGVNQHLYTKDTVINCPEELEVGNKIITNSHPVSKDPAVKTLADVIAESINTGIAQVAIKLGPERFIKYIKAFGFGQRAGIGISSEEKGILRETQYWAGSDIGRIAFGQSIAVTPLQLTAAISAIANGGVRMKPYIIKKVESNDRNYIQTFDSERVVTVISPHSARQVTQMMEATVYKKRGTGHPAWLERWKVAAKTGTAQKPVPGGRGYLKGRYIGSFVGFVPSENPRLTILVVIDDPQGGTFSGEKVAGPVFRAIAEEALLYLNVPPDEKVPPIEPRT